MFKSDPLDPTPINEIDKHGGGREESLALRMLSDLFSSSENHNPSTKNHDPSTENDAQEEHSLEGKKDLALLSLLNAATEEYLWYLILPYDRFPIHYI